MSGIECFSNEILTHILSFLKAKELVKVAQTCWRFNALTQTDMLWKSLCKQDFQIASTEGWGDGISFYEMYSKVLHQYGKCQGYWRNADTPFGIFFHVKMEKGQLVCHYCHHPVSETAVGNPLQWYSPMFTITMIDGKCQAVCGESSSHAGVSVKVIDDMLNYECVDCIKAVSRLERGFGGSMQMVMSWARRTGVAEREEDHPGVQYRDIHVVETTKLWSSYSMSRLAPTFQSPISPIILGMYQGTYGSHGIELIHVTMQENGYQICGHKITGDQNVPAGQISLDVDLRQPIILTEEEQTLSVINRLEVETHASPFCFPANASHPFTMPAGFSLTVRSLPTTCKARYNAQGQIASVGFISPRMSPAHLIVFSDDYFAFLWLELASLSVFKLVKDLDLN